MFAKPSNSLLYDVKLDLDDTSLNQIPKTVYKVFVNALLTLLAIAAIMATTTAFVFSFAAWFHTSASLDFSGICGQLVVICGTNWSAAFLMCLYWSYADGTNLP
jgi:hypothetical protein